MEGVEACVTPAHCTGTGLTEPLACAGPINVVWKHFPFLHSIFKVSPNHPLDGSLSVKTYVTPGVRVLIHGLPTNRVELSNVALRCSALSR